MPRYEEAADWSKFQPVHSEDDLRTLKRAGVKLIIPGSWHGDKFGRNRKCRGDLRRARRVGLHTATYVKLDAPGGTAARQAVRRGKEICGDEEWRQLRFVAVDIEIPGVTTAQIADGIAEVRALGQRPIIYTAHWFWTGHLGNSQKFCDIPLWDADYTGNQPDIHFDRRPYGCWDAADVVGKQYFNTTTLEGIELDRNTFDMDWVEAWPVKEEEEMAWIAKVRGGQAQYVVTVENGSLKKKRLPNPTVRRDLEKLLGTESVEVSRATLNLMHGAN